MMPTNVERVWMIGMKDSCTYWLLDVLAYREKSGMLQASVEKLPQMEDIADRNAHAVADPVSVACCEKIGPAPPALCTRHPMVARAAAGVIKSLARNRGLSFRGGIKSNGNWMNQNIT